MKKTIAAAALLALASGMSVAQVPADPLAGLENAAAPQTEAFYREQAQATRAVLDRVAGREALRRRIAQLSGSQVLVSGLAEGGPRYFYLRLDAASQSPRLVMREGVGGAERLVLDPVTLVPEGAHSRLAWISPSADGRFVAFGVSASGSATTTLHVVAVDSARLEPLEIDRVPRDAQVAWQGDARAFYYPRVVEATMGQDAPETRIYRHVLGRATERDEIVFGPGVGGALGVSPAALAALHVPADSRAAFAVVPDSAGNALSIYATEQKELAAGKPRWRRLAGPEDGILAIEAWRDDVYLLSKRNSPRHHVLLVKAGATSLAGAKVAVPEGDSVIRSMALARDALYLRTMVAGVDRLERLPLGILASRTPQFVRIPFDVAITHMVAQPRAEGVLLHLEGWIDPPSLVYVDRRGDAQPISLQPAGGADFSQVDEVRLYAPSGENVKIPITLIYRKSTRLTRDNPTLLVAYGSYGVPLMPTFDAARLAWLERGGVIAVAHLRGGGEYGEAWHEAGRGAFKSNTVADLVAVADFLGRYGFTGPGRLAVMGTGEGAVPAALAFERRPDLFAVGIFRMPVTDLARAMQASRTGPALQAEFGADAQALSPLQQVHPSLPYGSVMLTTRSDADAPPPWHAAKLAARLRDTTSSGRPVLLRPYAPGQGERAGREEELTDLYAFLLWQMGDPEFQGPPQASAGPPPAAH